MNASVTNEVVAVIRGVGERTLPLCRALLETQVAKDNVFFVSEVPFEKTLRRCYEIGIESNSRWMLTLDADVLLFPGSVRTLVNAAEAMPSHYAQIEGCIYDRILGMHRQAGHRIYRTSLLQRAIQLVPEDGTKIRPEFETLRQLGKQGYPSRCIPEYVGLHDFEQYYADLYRKAYVHAVKHAAQVARILRRSASLGGAEPDFLVIRKAILDSLESEEHLSIDKSEFEGRSASAIALLRLKEKEPLVEGSPSQLLSRLRRNADEFRPDFSIRDSIPSATGGEQRVVRLLERARKQGFTSVFLRQIAARLGRFADALQKND